jgi:hypothetical protein
MLFKYQKSWECKNYFDAPIIAFFSTDKVLTVLVDNSLG